MPLRCIIDGKKGKKEIGKTTFGGHTFSVLRCSKCNLGYIYSSDKDLAKVLKKYYSGEYQKEYHEKKIPLKNLRESISRKLKIYYAQADSQLGFLKRNGINEKKTLCDLGCGKGEFLIWAEKKGYKSVGVEPDIERIRIAKKYMKRTQIKQAFLENKNLPKKDVYLMLHVLEHLENPIKVLKNLKKNNPKSFLFIEVPNTATREGLKTSMKEPHIFHFNKSNLKKLIEKTGWRVESVSIMEKKGIFRQLFWIFTNKDVCDNKKNGSVIRIFAK